MEKSKKEKITTIAVVCLTVTLAGVAVFTALRLYQLRQQSISLISPEGSEACGGTPCISKKPTPTPKLTSCKAVSFTLDETPTNTPTSTPTNTPTSTPTGSPTNTPTGSPTITTTTTPTTTSTPTPTQPQENTSTPTPTQSGQAQGSGDTLPSAGTPLPTLLMIIASITIIVLAFALAF